MQQLVKISQELSNKLANMALICSFLVVFIHTGPEASKENVCSWFIYHLINDSICRIAVPFFFIVAGFFLAGHCFEVGWYLKECKKRIFTLVIPYFVWSTLYAVFGITLIIGANFLSGVELTRNFPSLGHIYGLNFISSPNLVPLWFIRTLMLFVLISPVVNCFVRSRYFGVLVLSCLYTLSYFCEWKYFNPTTLFYFSLGFYLRLWLFRLTKNAYIIGSLFLIGILAAGLSLYGEYMQILYLNYLKILVLPCLLISIWARIPSARWNSRINACTFPIFLIHCFVLSVLNIVQKYNPLCNYINDVVLYLINGMLVIGVSICITLLLQRYLPNISSFLFGGRTGR